MVVNSSFQIERDRQIVANVRWPIRIQIDIFWDHFRQIRSEPFPCEQYQLTVAVECNYKDNLTQFEQGECKSNDDMNTFFENPALADTFGVQI